ncbi:MAG TPA: hypothetical protein VGR94_09550 [Candidatus Acidoferrales bacterium]|nr:hypothetical protein [Candidatus Acidoferrales bacterium]
MKKKVLGFISTGGSLQKPGGNKGGVKPPLQKHGEKWSFSTSCQAAAETQEGRKRRVVGQFEFLTAVVTIKKIQAAPPPKGEVK